MGDKTLAGFNGSAAPTSERGAATPPTFTIDMDYFLRELEGCEVSDAQKVEFLETLANIMWHFVDLGFQVDISELSLPGDESGVADSSGRSPNTETRTAASTEGARP